MSCDTTTSERVEALLERIAGALDVLAGEARERQAAAHANEEAEHLRLAGAYRNACDRFNAWERRLERARLTDRERQAYEQSDLDRMATGDALAAFEAVHPARPRLQQQIEAVPA